jgi:hypothetical protein
MIVCSCNVLSEAQVTSATASAAPAPRMSCVCASLGCGEMRPLRAHHQNHARGHQKLRDYRNWHRGDLIITDDPQKPANAQSDARRNKQTSPSSW